MPPVRSVLYSPQVSIHPDFYHQLRGFDGGEEVSELHVVGPAGQITREECGLEFGSVQGYLNQIIASFPGGYRIQISGRESSNGSFGGEEVPPNKATTYLFSIFYPGNSPMHFLLEPREEELLKNRGVAEAALNAIVGKYYEKGTLPQAIKWFFFESGWTDRQNNGKPVFVKVIDA